MLRLDRVLVGLDGRQPDAHVIRYAAMLARLDTGEREFNVALPPRRASRTDRADRDRRAPRSSNRRVDSEATSVLTERYHACDPHSPRTNGDAEVRFVSLVPHRDEPDARPWRAALTAGVNECFRPMRLPVAIRCDLLTGDVLERLPDVATDFDADLLLVDDASCPRSTWPRLAAATATPLWLAPRGCAPVLRRVLVPIDFSASSIVCLQTAVDLASRFPPAKVLALHVDHTFTRFDDGTLAPAPQREVAQRLAALTSGIERRGVAIEPVFVRGVHVDRAIADTVDRYATDLTILTVRRRSRLTRALCPGRSAATVRQCPGPVLLLPSAERPLTLFEALQQRWRRAEMPQFS